MNPTLEYNHFTVKKGTVLGYAIFPYPVNLKYDKSIPQDVRLSQTKSGLLNQVFTFMQKYDIIYKIKKDHLNGIYT